MSSATALRDLAPEALAPRALSACLGYPDAAWVERVRALLAGAPVRGRRALLDALDAEGVSDLQAEHFRLFGPAAACRPELVPYLTDNDFAQARKMADLAGFHQAFGLDAPARRPDDVAVTLEFLSFLKFKRRYALANGWAERAEVTRLAERALTEGYLRPGLEKFAAALAERAGTRFHRALAHACRSFARKRWWTWWR